MADALPAVLSGEGVLVSENFCSHFGLKYGETIELPSPTGPVRARNRRGLSSTTSRHRHGRDGSPLLSSALRDPFDSTRSTCSLKRPPNHATVRAALAAGFLTTSNCSFSTTKMFAAT